MCCVAWRVCSYEITGEREEPFPHPWFTTRARPALESLASPPSLYLLLTRSGGIDLDTYLDTPSLYMNCLLEGSAFANILCTARISGFGLRGSCLSKVFLCLHRCFYFCVVSTS